MISKSQNQNANQDFQMFKDSKTNLNLSSRFKSIRVKIVNQTNKIQTKKNLLHNHKKY